MEEEEEGEKKTNRNTQEKDGEEKEEIAENATTEALRNENAIRVPLCAWQRHKSQESLSPSRPHTYNHTLIIANCSFQITVSSHPKELQ